MLLTSSFFIINLIEKTNLTEVSITNWYRFRHIPLRCYVLNITQELNYVFNINSWNCRIVYEKMKWKWKNEKITWKYWHRYVVFILLTLSSRRSLSYRNQSIDFENKSMAWFLYHRDLRHERVDLEHILHTLLVVVTGSN